MGDARQAEARTLRHSRAGARERGTRRNAAVARPRGERASTVSAALLLGLGVAAQAAWLAALAYAVYRLASLL